MAPSPEQLSEISPSIQHEVEDIARVLDKLSLRKTAARVRALLGPMPDDERPYPMQEERQRRGLTVRAIPWGLAEMLHPAYGHGQSLERMAERGGFGRAELGALASDTYSPGGRLDRMPLLDLYEMAKRGSRS